MNRYINISSWIIGAGLLLSVFGCANTSQSLPQSARAGDKYGRQIPAITYNITATARDTAFVVITIGTTNQDASQQGSATQAQDGKPNSVPTVSPNISASIPVSLTR